MTLIHGPSLFFRTFFRSFRLSPSCHCERSIVIPAQGLLSICSGAGIQVLSTAKYANHAKMQGAYHAPFLGGHAAPPYVIASPARQSLPLACTQTQSPGNYPQIMSLRAQRGNLIPM